MRMSDLTALGRLPDPSYPTNRAIMALALVVVVAGAIFRLFSGLPLLESALWGVGAGFAVFLSWALGREIDPDHDLSAFAGVALMLLGLVFFDLPFLLVLLWLLLTLRVVNRTIGLPTKPLDSLAVLGLGGWLTWQGHWMVGLMTAVAFLLNGLLATPLRYHLLLSGLAFVATVVLSIFHGDIAMEGGSTMPIVISSAVIAGLFLVVIVTSREVQTVGDATGDPLNPRRVQAAQSLALLTALLYAWWEGAAGVVTLLPLWAALLGVALYRLTILFLSHSR
jgi:hypothetical protein